jgi:hypothetical protein
MIQYDKCFSWWSVVSISSFKKCMLLGIVDKIEDYFSILMLNLKIIIFSLVLGLQTIVFSCLTCLTGLTHQNYFTYQTLPHLSNLSNLSDLVFFQLFWVAVAALQTIVPTWFKPQLQVWPHLAATRSAPATPTSAESDMISR